MQYFTACSRSVPCRSQWRYTSARRSSTTAESALRLRQLMRHVAQPVAVVTVELAVGHSLEPVGQASQPRVHHGATISSLSSISLSPPLVSFSLRLPSRLASALLSTPYSLSAAERGATSSSTSAIPRRFRIYLLSSQQEGSASTFARQPTATTPSHSSPAGELAAPLFTSGFKKADFEELEASALGYLSCSLVKSIPLSPLGEDESSGSNEKLAAGKTRTSGTKSELFIARVEEVHLGTMEDRGSLVYWDQKYNVVG